MRYVRISKKNGNRTIVTREQALKMLSGNYIDPKQTALLLDDCVKLQTPFAYYQKEQTNIERFTERFLGEFPE